MNKLKFAGLAAASALLAACGGYVYTSIGGTVTGLGTDDTNTLVLINERAFPAKLTRDGDFSFPIASNAAYKIQVFSQPSLVFCTVNGGTGVMQGEGEVKSVRVACAPNVQVKGTVAGMGSGGVVTLQNATPDFDKRTVLTDSPIVQNVTANGAFSLSRYVVHGDPYEISVYAPPAGQYCTVANAKGVADNTKPELAANVAVSCANAVPIGFTVNGLTAGTLLQITNKSALKEETKAVSAIGIYRFAWSWPDATAYTVSIKAQPIDSTGKATGQTCSVDSGASGVASMANPSASLNIVVNCK
ncbi:hypothetical protein [Undibacterium squillarum]|uniref:hypothetical protein n=1 Tax=Undibacterium squillarum TaxID=1131567 RepID=UPI0035AFBDE5